MVFFIVDSTSPRKGKTDPTEDSDTEQAKKPKLIENPTPPTAPVSSELNEVAESNMEVLEGTRKRKRNRKKNKGNKTTEEKLESESLLLKVLPKKSWRQLRNRYLNLQRQNMSKLKKQLRDQYLREQHYQNCGQQESEDLEQNSKIIEILLDTAADSVEAFKKQIKVDLAGESEEEAAISGFIKYVDYDEDSLRAYIRFNDDSSFTSRIEAFLSAAEKVFKKARFLTGENCLLFHSTYYVQNLLKELPINCETYFCLYHSSRVE
jgi:hypothetical protein